MATNRFQKRHYEQIADVLGKQFAQATLQPEALVTLRAVMADFSAMLKADSPATFKEDLFVQAVRDAMMRHM